MNALRKRYVPDHYPRVERSQMEILLELTAVMGLIFQGIILLKWWPELPLTVPTHFGPTGLPDTWGDKNSLFLLPAVSVGLFMLLGVLSQFPKLYNYPVRITEENHVVQYLLARALLSWIRTEIIWMFACLTYLTILNSLGTRLGLGIAFVPITMVVMFSTIALYFFQAYQNK